MTPAELLARVDRAAARSERRWRSDSVHRSRVYLWESKCGPAYAEALSALDAWHSGADQSGLESAGWWLGTALAVERAEFGRSVGSLMAVRALREFRAALGAARAEAEYQEELEGSPRG
jgi:hypothetical protein